MEILVECKKKLYRFDFISLNLDCIVNIMKVFVKIYVVLFEFSCIGFFDSFVIFLVFEEFCVIFIFNLKNLIFSEVYFLCIISFVI